MPKCPAMVQGPGVVAHPCEIPIPEGVRDHLGPHASESVPASMRKRGIFLDERAREHAKANAVKSQFQDEPQASWQGLVRDPDTMRGEGRPHPQDERRTKAEAATRLPHASTEWDAVVTTDPPVRASDSDRDTPEEIHDDDYIAEALEGTDPLVEAHQKAVELAQFLGQALVQRDAERDVAAPPKD